MEYMFVTNLPLGHFFLNVCIPFLTLCSDATKRFHSFLNSFVSFASSISKCMACFFPFHLSLFLISISFIFYFLSLFFFFLISCSLVSFFVMHILSLLILNCWRSHIASQAIVDFYSLSCTYACCVFSC